MKESGAAKEKFEAVYSSYNNDQGLASEAQLSWKVPLGQLKGDWCFELRSNLRYAGEDYIDEMEERFDIDSSCYLRSFDSLLDLLKAASTLDHLQGNDQRFLQRDSQVCPESLRK